VRALDVQDLVLLEVIPRGDGEGRVAANDDWDRVLDRKLCEAGDGLAEEELVVAYRNLDGIRADSLAIDLVDEEHETVVGLRAVCGQTIS
jgi:hypothetical protein